jgi:hypothetical protein
MKPFLTLRATCGLLLTAVLLSRPAYADDDSTRNALIAAAAVAGVAAYVHHNKNHDNGKHHDDDRREAEYDRGYQDGLHGAQFNNYSRSDDYTQGYDAGSHDRNVKNSYNARNTWDADRHGAPDVARRVCVGEASSAWAINPRDITPTSSRELGKGRYEVIVAAGYHRAACEADSNGNVRGLRDLQHDTSWGHNAPHGRVQHGYSTDDYDATTSLRCSLNTASLNRYCDAGINRGKHGKATIRVTAPTGRERTFEFRKDSVSSPDGERLDWSHSPDLGQWNIGIGGREFYEIPDSAVVGG